MKATARALRDERIARAYDGSLRATAKLFGMSHEAIRKILIAQGVEIAPACTWSPSTHLSAAARPSGAYQAALVGLGEAGAFTPSMSNAVKGQQGRTNSHRMATPACDISAGTLSGVETVPAASPSHAAGTHYSVR